MLHFNVHFIYKFMHLCLAVTAFESFHLWTCLTAELDGQLEKTHAIVF